MLLLPYLNVLIRYALRFGLSFLTAWITTCTWDTTLSMTMESQLRIPTGFEPVLQRLPRSALPLAYVTLN
ncbi:hypothetical protein VPH234P10_0034 [Vibrio phage 234P10]